METTAGRRKLAAASAPAVPLQGLCEEVDYLTTEATADSIFDQLTPQEYLDVAQYLVRALTWSMRPFAATA